MNETMCRANKHRARASVCTHIHGSFFIFSTLGLFFYLCPCVRVVSAAAVFVSRRHWLVCVCVCTRTAAGGSIF